MVSSRPNPFGNTQGIASYPRSERGFVPALIVIGKGLVVLRDRGAFAVSPEGVRPG